MAYIAVLVLGVALGYIATKENHMFVKIRRTLFGGRKRRIAIIATVLGSIAAVALAQFLTDATGPASARAGSLSPITVSYGTIAGSIDPGSNGGAHVIAHNGNAASFTITGVVDPGGEATFLPGTGGSGCTDALLVGKVNVNTLTGLSINVPPGDTEITLPQAFHVSSTLPAECFGSGFLRNVRVQATAG